MFFMGNPTSFLNRTQNLLVHADRFGVFSMVFGLYFLFLVFLGWPFLLTNSTSSFRIHPKRSPPKTFNVLHSRIRSFQDSLLWHSSYLWMLSFIHICYIVATKENAPFGLGLTFLLTWSTWIGLLCKHRLQKRNRIQLRTLGIWPLQMPANLRNLTLQGHFLHR